MWVSLCTIKSILVDGTRGGLSTYPPPLEVDETWTSPRRTLRCSQPTRRHDEIGLGLGQLNRATLSVPDTTDNVESTHAGSNLPGYYYYLLLASPPFPIPGIDTMATVLQCATVQLKNYFKRSEANFSLGSVSHRGGARRAAKSATTGTTTSLDHQTKCVTC